MVYRTQKQAGSRRLIGICTVSVASRAARRSAGRGRPAVPSGWRPRSPRSATVPPPRPLTAASARRRGSGRRPTRCRAPAPGPAAGWAAARQARRQVGPGPVQRRGQRARPGQVGDPLVSVPVAPAERPQPRPLVGLDGRLGDAGELEEQLIPGHLVLPQGDRCERVRHRDDHNPADPVRGERGRGPRHRRATIKYELEERAMVAKLFFECHDDLKELELFQMHMEIIRNLIILCRRQESH